MSADGGYRAVVVLRDDYFSEDKEKNSTYDHLWVNLNQKITFTVIGC